MRHLPTLRNGINLLDVPANGTGALQSLAMSHLITFGGEAVWVDSHNNASTHLMHRIAPQQEFLERINVARAFTAFQHYTLADNLPVDVARDTSLVVLPELNYLYDHDNLMDGEGDDMLEHVMTTLQEVVQRYQIPVLMTTHDSSFIESYADTTIQCRITDMGVFFESANFRTLVYPGNGYVQTTLELWRLIVEEQFKHHRRQEAVAEVTHG